MNEKKERIVFDVAYQPQVRTNTETRRIMLDVIIALLPAVIVGVINFGAAILLPIATSVASAVFFEWGYRKFMKKHDTIGDLTAVLTGLLMAMTMPPQAPWWMPVIGTFFAIVVVKQLYAVKVECYIDIVTLLKSAVAAVEYATDSLDRCRGEHLALKGVAGALLLHNVNI